MQWDPFLNDGKGGAIMPPHKQAQDTPMVGPQHKDRGDPYVVPKPHLKHRKSTKSPPKFVTGDRFDHYEMFATAPWAWSRITDYSTTKSHQYRYKTERHFYPEAVGRTDVGVGISSDVDVTKVYKENF